MSKLYVDQIDPKTATTLTLGTSGDTITIPAGVNANLGSTGSTITIPSGSTIVNSGTATGFGSALSEVDLWRVTANFTGATFVTSNWERCDTNFEKIGTGMSESSGVFTFPSTGIYQVDFHMTEFQASYETTGGLKIEVSINGGAAFASNAETYCTIASVSSATAYATGDARVILDVTNTSNFQVKFYVWNSSATVYGSSTVNYTYATFKKLGDT